jgi:hypothetical protein
VCGANNATRLLAKNTRTKRTPCGRGERSPTRSLTPIMGDDGEVSEEQERLLRTQNMIAPAFVPGDKVVIGISGERVARVMFVGQLPSMPAGYWVGVQFDDKVGKNDGTLHGKRYFTCPPGHGSFLRSSKISLHEDVPDKHTKAEEAPPDEKKKKRKSKGRDRAASVEMDDSSLVRANQSPEAAAEAAAAIDMDNRMQRRKSLAAWQNSIPDAMSTMRAALSPHWTPHTARRTRPPGSTHPYRVKVNGSGLSSAVVGSLAQFTVIAHDGTLAPKPLLVYTSMTAVFVPFPMRYSAHCTPGLTCVPCPVQQRMTIDAHGGATILRSRFEAAATRQSLSRRCYAQS